MKKLIIVSMLFFSCASKNKSNNLQTTYSTNNNRLPANFILAEPIWQKAVVKLLSSNASCSGAFVSDEGHLLTATHCLDLCEKSQEDGNNFCSLIISKKKIKFQVLLMHPCANNIKDTFQGVQGDIKKAICVNQADLALLKPIDFISLPSFNCLEIDQSSIKISENIFSLGYPAETNRPEGENSDGNSLYKAIGQVVDAPVCYKSNGQTVDFEKSMNSQWSVARKSGVFIQTTVDNVVGNSGGPLLNSNGKIIGVSSFSTVSLDYKTGSDMWDHTRVGVLNTAEECRGASYFARISILNQMAKEQNTLLNIEKIKCDQRKLKPNLADIPR